MGKNEKPFRKVKHRREITTNDPRSNHQSDSYLLFHLLPNEIIDYIICFLKHDLHNISSLRRVCMQIKNLIDSSTWWKRITNLKTYKQEGYGLGKRITAPIYGVVTSVKDLIDFPDVLFPKKLRSSKEGGPETTIKLLILNEVSPQHTNKLLVDLLQKVKKRIIFPPSLEYLVIRVNNAFIVSLYMWMETLEPPYDVDDELQAFVKFMIYMHKKFPTVSVYFDCFPSEDNFPPTRSATRIGNKTKDFRFKRVAENAIKGGTSFGINNNVKIPLWENGPSLTCLSISHTKLFIASMYWNVTKAYDSLPGVLSVEASGFRKTIIERDLGHYRHGSQVVEFYIYTWPMSTCTESTFNDIKFLIDRCKHLDTGDRVHFSIFHKGDVSSTINRLATQMFLKKGSSESDKRWETAVVDLISSRDSRK